MIVLDGNGVAMGKSNELKEKDKLLFEKMKKYISKANTLSKLIVN